MSVSQLHIENLLDELPLSSESQCSYFTEKQSRSRLFRIQNTLPPELFEVALNKGYRRCGDVYYQMDCAHCDLCRSYRINIDEFRPSTSQRRVLRKNKDIRFQVVSPIPSPEKEDIYLRYQYEQHYVKDIAADEDIPHFDPHEHITTMHYQMYTNHGLTKEIELYLDDKLIGFGIIDLTTVSVSAVYFVFDPNYKNRSLGTFAILKGVEWAKQEAFHFYHLGFYIPGHPKMEYKKGFGAAAILDRKSRTWVPTMRGGL